jgi:hypothetical protein
MSLQRQISFRIPLMILQLVIALLLSWVGAKQTSAQAAQAQNLVPWDYVAPAETILHSINFPAAMATGLLTNQRVLTLGFEYSRWRFAVYFCLIAGLWYAVGLCIDRRYLKSISTMKKPLIVAGLIGSVLLFLMSVLLIGGPSAPILVIAAFLWSGFLLYFFGRLLWRGWPPSLGASTP